MSEPLDSLELARDVCVSIQTLGDGSAIETENPMDIHALAAWAHIREVLFGALSLLVERPPRTLASVTLLRPLMEEAFRLVEYADGDTRTRVSKMSFWLDDENNRLIGRSHEAGKLGIGPDPDQVNGYVQRQHQALDKLRAKHGITRRNRRKFLHPEEVIRRYGDPSDLLAYLIFHSAVHPGEWFHVEQRTPMDDGTWAIGLPTGDEQLPASAQTIATAGIAMLRAHFGILNLACPASVEELHARLQALAADQGS